MDSFIISDRVFRKLERIKNMDPRHARLSLAFKEASEISELIEIENELNKIIDEIESQEEKRWRE